MDELPFKVTGNPFVDTGLAAISYLAKKESFIYLTHKDVLKVFDNGQNITDWNSRLKSFTMIFGNNGPLYQPRGKSNEKIRKEKYTSILSSLLDQICNPNESSGICECCGNGYNCNLTLAYNSLDEKNKKEYFVGRDYFPLIGSLGSDAQALPASSRMFYVCPKCLFAVNYIPLATRLLDGRLIAFEGAHTPFIQDLIGSIVDENISKLNLSKKEVETIGKKEPTSKIIEWMCNRFQAMQEAKRRNLLPNTEMNIWLFSNSGTSPDCEVIKIPDSSIRFIWEAARHGLNLEISFMSKIDKKLGSRDQLLNAIRNKTDYKGLYPRKDYPGASIEMYSFYQIMLLDIPRITLVNCQKLASEILPDNPKEKKEWLKFDVFNDFSKRNILRSKICELIEKGRFTVDDYFSIFPIKEVFPLSVNRRGFDILRYFLTHLEDEIPDYKNKNELRDDSMKMHPKILEASTLYFNDFVENRGLTRFKKEVLDEFKRGTKSVFWLKNVLCQLAENNEGFGPKDWDSFWHDLSHNENGEFVGYELLFQMRLALSDLYRQKVEEKSANLIV